MTSSMRNDIDSKFIFAMFASPENQSASGAPEGELDLGKPPPREQQKPSIFQLSNLNVIEDSELLKRHLLN